MSSFDGISSLPAPKPAKEESGSSKGEGIESEVLDSSSHELLEEDKLRSVKYSPYFGFEQGLTSESILSSLPTPH